MMNLVQRRYLAIEEQIIGYVVMVCRIMYESVTFSLGFVIWYQENSLGETSLPHKPQLSTSNLATEIYSKDLPYATFSSLEGSCLW